ncbi:alpha/beta hydrolase [Rhodococcus olei]|uniref:Alpha/beta hydrolase n=1 Tax=Rhodococcus olei TaxID=2161675 RepID=A0ABP8NZC9_9NOCA
MRLKVAVALLALSLATAGCSGGESGTPASSTAGHAGRATTITPGGNADFAGLVDIGGGRKIYVECAGAGSPTVVLVAGKGNGAHDGWGEVLDPTDPVRQSPDDQVALGEGNLGPSDTAVFPSVAKFTRVCAYSRPGTGLDDPQTSTPVPQPHRVADAVADLHAALGAAGESGPYVLVGHSYGGLIVRLFASMYPREVSGLVMEDVVSEFETETTTPDEFANWDKLNSTTDGTHEAVLLIDAIDEIRAAPAMPDVPAVVLSSDKPPNRQAIEAQSKEFGALPTFGAWLAAHDLLTKFLRAEHITGTNSGHNIEVYQPKLVTDAIHTVVDQARGK